MKNNYDVKEKIVRAGNSEVLKNWMEHSSITEDDFLLALEWVCNDPCDAMGRATRAIGLTPAGIVKLNRAYGVDGLCVFYLNGKLWDGEIFKRPAANDHEKLFAMDGINVEERHKITLSCKDRV